MTGKPLLPSAEQRVETGARATAALQAASAVIDERQESAINTYVAKHEGGNMTHDEYVRFTERLATLRRLRSDLERQRGEGEQAQREMVQESP